MLHFLEVELYQWILDENQEWTPFFETIVVTIGQLSRESASLFQLKFELVSSSQTVLFKRKRSAFCYNLSHLSSIR